MTMEQIQEEVAAAHRRSMLEESRATDERDVLVKCRAIRVKWLVANPRNFHFATSTIYEWLDYDKKWKLSRAAAKCRKLIEASYAERRAVAEADYNRRAGMK